MFERDGTVYNHSEMRKIVLDDISQLARSKTGRKVEAIRLSSIETANSVLDVGSEIGTFLNALKNISSQDCRFVGVDVNKNSVDIANEFLADRQIKFLLNDAEQLPFNDGEFDRVFALEVMEHLRNVEACLKEVNRVLTVGGLFVLSVPNATAFRSMFKVFISDTKLLSEEIDTWPEFTPDQRDHVNNYDFLHLYRILSLNGFKFRSIAYTGWKMPWLGKIPVFKKFSSTIVLCVEKKSQS